jgi:hypothetical protein
MRDRPDRISCAVATANGFAMQIPSSQTTSGADQNQGKVPSEGGARCRAESGASSESQLARLGITEAA